MNIKNLNYLIGIGILSLLLTSCLMTQKMSYSTISGQYLSRHLTTYRHLNLFEDSTFLYSWGGSLLQGETKGQWEIRSNHLILNSEIQPSPKKIPPLTILKKTLVNQDSITIQIVDQALLPVTNAIVLLKSPKTELIISGKEVDKNGLVNIPNIDSIDLLIKVFPFQEVEYSLVNCPYNFFIFQLKISSNRYIFFEQEKWKYRKEKLYMPLPHRFIPYSRKNYLEKVNSQDDL